MKKPFVKLLKSPYNFYAFDVNKNEIVSLEKNSYDYLRNVIEGKTGGEETLEIKKMKDIGYFSSNNIKEIEHTQSQFIDTILERKINKITLQITQNCNLRCSYCVYSDFYNDSQRSHTGNRMDYNIAKCAIDFLVCHSIDNSEVNISFYGGEPILEFELIKKTVLYAESQLKGKKITFNLTTNGTLLNANIIDFFSNHDIRLMISLDGPQNIHDISRRYAKDGKGTFDDILKNIRVINENHSDYMKNLSFSTVIDPQNDFNLITSLFENNKILKGITVHSTIIDDIYSIEKISYSQKFIEERVYKTFLAFLYRLGKVDIKHISSIVLEEITRIDDKIKKMKPSYGLPDNGAPAGPCVPGQMRLFIDVYGNFFPCERVNETSETMNIGNLDQGFDFEKVKNILNISKLTEEECRTCWAINHCILCAKYADDGKCFSREMRLSHCSAVRNLIKETFQSIIMLEECNELENKREENQKC